jgi:mono/diheme cytochrome c family protein
MRRLVLVAIALPLLAGCFWTSPEINEGGSPEMSVPRWVREESLPPAAVPGAKLFAVAGCTACHTYAGSGGSNLGAPDLTAIGLRHLGVDFEIRHLTCPSCVVHRSPMPPFASLGPKRLQQLAIFLEASKGTH